MVAVEEYNSAFQTGLSQPGDVLNVPVTLLDDAWVASHRICADATLVGRVFAASPLFDAKIGAFRCRARFRHRRALQGLRSLPLRLRCSAARGVARRAAGV